MLSELSSIIIREIILRFNEYESIINFKLTNKRLFKFIEYDIVIQRYYLKLRYNLILKDEDILKYLHLLDSKCYSKYLTYFTSFKKEVTIFVNPHNDYFIICIKTEENNVPLLIMSKDNVSIDKITDSILENKIEIFKDTLVDEGYLLLDVKYVICFQSLPDRLLCPYLIFKQDVRYKITDIDRHIDLLEIRNEIKLTRHVYSDEFNQTILEKIKLLISNS